MAIKVIVRPIVCTETPIYVFFVAIVCGHWVSLSQGLSLPCVSNGQPCSDQLCPHTAVQLNCNVPNNKLGTTTQWTTSSPNCTLELDQRVTFDCSGQTSTSPPCPPFTAVNANVTGPCNTSTLSFVMSPNLNGTLITCATATVAGIIGSITLISVAAPSVPHLSITAELNGLEVKCFSGDQNTHCNVTIQMNGAVKSIAGNTTFNGLTSNMMYPISARAINRCGDYSETSASHWTLPEAPPISTIRVLQSLINESATQLDISWSHIGGNVSQYKVKSLSGMNIFTSQVSVQSYCVDLRCAYHQIVQTTGSHYTTTISSVNDGGEGPESDPVQAQSNSSSSPSYLVGVEVGVGIGVGVPLLICISAALVFVTCYLKKQSRHSYVVMNACISELKPNGSTVDQHASGDALSVTMDVGRTPSSKLAPSQNIAEPPIHSSSKQYVTSQDPQLNTMQERKPFKRLPHYVRVSNNGTVLTIQDGELVFATLNAIPEDNQLWYIDGQPDNSFMITSKTNRMVLACIENEIVIQNRLGDDSQKWLQERDTIVSLKHGTVMCAKDPDNVPVCVKKTLGHGVHSCCLQAGLIVPMFLVEERDGSVLEVNADKVTSNSNMDATNLSQHWYIYRDSQRDETFVIVSRKEQKVLQLKDKAHLIVKESISKEEDAQWTMKNERIVVECCDSEKESTGCTSTNVSYKKRVYKQLQAYPVFRNNFLIRFQSYHLTWDLFAEQVILQDNVNKSMPFDRHIWVLSMQPDGTFILASSINNKQLLLNEIEIKNEPNGNVNEKTKNISKLVCRHLTCDNSHLWRREGNFIKSEINDGYLCRSLVSSGNVTLPISCVGNDESRSEDECVTAEVPSLAIECMDDGDKEKLKYRCATTSMVIQVSQIVHQGTDSVLSTGNGNSEVFISPRNPLPHSTQFWVLDYRLDGNFFIISDTTERSVLAFKSSTTQSAENQLILTQFNGEESQLWRFDGGHIESVKFKDQVISLMSGNPTSLCLSTKYAGDKAQLFKEESYTPVLIRCLMDNTVLELDDTSALKFSESCPNSQVWYLKYRNGFNHSSFMIISKNNEMALQVVGQIKYNVEPKKMDSNNEDQQWRREGLLIKSSSGLSMANNRQQLVLVKYPTSKKSSCFEFQHCAVESYF